MFESKNFGSKNIFGSKNLGSKIFWVKNKFGVKKNLGQKNSSQKYFGSRRIVSANFFCPKKIRVGLTQGGGCMTPPQKKIVGLKLCWVVVSFVR